jgi:hypothetical protein
MYFHTRKLSAGIGLADIQSRAQARQTLLYTWRAGLDTRPQAPELRVLEAVLPNRDVWLLINNAVLQYIQIIFGQYSATYPYYT